MGSNTNIDTNTNNVVKNNKYKYSKGKDFAKQRYNTLYLRNVIIIHTFLC